MSCDDRELEDINQPLVVSEIIETPNFNANESNDTDSEIEQLKLTSLDNLNNDLKIKPSHWSEEYWETITSTYKWFLHKDGNGGCNICFVNKVFMGKKSLLATLKLKLLDLSYSDFEKKLHDHSMTIQHIKSVALFDKYDVNTNIQDGSIAKSISNNLTILSDNTRRFHLDDYPCPICNKNYKMKKVLIKHIYSCNNVNHIKKFLPPCDCDNVMLHSIRSLDDHNEDIHGCKFIFKCHFCSAQFEEATSIFGHYLHDHNYQWDPFTFMPEVVVGQVKIVKDQMKSSSRADRKKSCIKNDDIWYRYDTDGDAILPSETNNVKRRKTTKNDDDFEFTVGRSYTKPEISNKIEKESPYNPNKLIYTSSNIVDRVINTSELFSFRSMERTQTANKNVENIIINDKNEASHLMFSIEQIHICDYCGGRYLSSNILKEHVSTRHLFAENNVESEDENLKRKYRKKLNAITDSLINHRQNTDLDSAQNKRPHVKKKPTDAMDINCPDNTISHCLLTCPVCQESFLNLDDRNEHVSKNHPEIEQFVCHHCGLIFNNHSNYNKHLEKSHNNLISKTSRNNDSVTYSCTICPLVFTNTADLSHHIKLSHPQSLVDITTSSLDEEDKESHIVQVEEPRETILQPPEAVVIEEPKPISISEQHLLNLIEADPSEKSCYCPSCDLTLHNAFEFVVHKMTHEEEDVEIDIPTCPNCNRLFFGEFGKIYLKDHYNVDHLKKLPPQCIICNISLSSSFALEKHQVNGFCQVEDIADPYQPLMEENKMAFSCSQCGMIYAGENAYSRLEIHNKTCASDLMDADEFLDS